MKACSLVFLISFVLLFSFSRAGDYHVQGFIQCLIFQTNVSITNVTYTPNNASYEPIYEFSLRNPRLNNSDRLKPEVIVTPVSESQVQAVVRCAQWKHLRIRTRCGGHDFEGLSYSSTYDDIPFVLLDMINLRNVTVNATAKTAIIGAGATLGEVYYWIYRASGTLAFPAGVWSTVGATGLICGGGYGVLRRKYGLAADNILDVRIVDVHGNILDRETMGEDLFWALRGGTCSSFGVVLSWKLNLVDVPQTVAIFNIMRTLEQNATQMILPFQTVARNLPYQLDLRVRISTILSNTSSRPDNKTVELTFTSVYLGPADELYTIIQTNLPELRLLRSEVQNVTWIQAIMINSFFPLFDDNYTPEDLLDRTFLADIPTKAKSDFVREPIPDQGINGLWDKLLQVNPGDTTVIFTPYGGVLDEYPESAIPFPNRNGTLYMVYMRILWVGNTTQKLEWIRGLYEYLRPYVSSNPRRAYYNYDDLDLGANNERGPINYINASRWGRSYFNRNFMRLVWVKTQVDPSNFFRHELTIPPFSLAMQSDM
ncbi:Cannabidiolic acid synthase [Heracleum sosnowskyi]|uniref:Cannabidiolic acid synthase n=1 Tax=Heracleum sosnowskyi TaxID=360622 RepID=A0AAD8J4H1_9APIA|nr:Cannabidiolic acid synthase [Heracleum sosnowskyi]